MSVALKQIPELYAVLEKWSCDGLVPELHAARVKLVIGDLTKTAAYATNASFRDTVDRLAAYAPPAPVPARKDNVRIVAR